MNGLDPAPPSLRRLATIALVAATMLALVNLPADELPAAWLCAFTLPGAVLGLWSRLLRTPWRRALLAVVMQAAACYGALELVGPMTRPAALACTILPPLAFTTTRNHDADPSLALFLSFCVLLVGVILDGLHVPILLGYGAVAFLSLHASTLLADHRSSSNATSRRQTARTADVAATSAMMLSCLVAVFAIDRTLSWLPSPSSARPGGDGATASLTQDRQVGLDDSFVLDGPGGMLSQLTGEQLVRASRSDGEPIAATMYLRCGFFSVPGMDRWGIGRLSLQQPSRTDGHTFRRPLPSLPVQELAIERYGGAARFVFLPPGSCEVFGLSELTVDDVREWIRPTVQHADPYTVSYQELPLPAADLPVDPRARGLGMLTLPRALDQSAFGELLDAWSVGREPLQAMASIRDGLAGHCRYDRSEPTGPYEHAIENFLFAEHDRHGYCMHFASAAALMLRMRGIACRIGVGLYGGATDRTEPGARIYGSQHAHAWVEVPFTGRGYVIFDPTPPSLRGRGFVPNETDQVQSDPIVEIESSFFDPTVRAIADTLEKPWFWAIVLGATLVLTLLPRRRPEPPAPAEPAVARRARRSLQKLLRALAKAGHRRPHRQTLELFAGDLQRCDRLRPEVLAAFATYQEVRFGGRPFDDVRHRRMESGIRAALTMRSEDRAESDAVGQT